MGADHPDTLLGMSNLAELLEEVGDLEAAETLHMQALAGRRQILPQGHRQIAFSCVKFARLLNRLERYPESEPLAREGLSIREGLLSTDAWEIGEARTVLGSSLAGLGRYQEAESLLLPGYSTVLSSATAPEHEKLWARQRVVKFYEAWGKPDKAAEYRALLPDEGEGES
jgi:hypothetical protein